MKFQCLVLTADPEYWATGTSEGLKVSLRQEEAELELRPPSVGSDFQLKSTFTLSPDLVLVITQRDVCQMGVGGGAEWEERESLHFTGNQLRLNDIHGHAARQRYS